MCLHSCILLSRSICIFFLYSVLLHYIVFPFSVMVLSFGFVLCDFGILFLSLVWVFCDYFGSRFCCTYSGNYFYLGYIGSYFCFGYSNGYFFLVLLAYTFFHFVFCYCLYHRCSHFYTHSFPLFFSHFPFLFSFVGAHILHISTSDLSVAFVHSFRFFPSSNILHRNVVYIIYILCGVLSFSSRISHMFLHFLHFHSISRHF
ncbi:unnamed protein product [Meganyctiphanes norvegica]|uniref:Uncharacterized protein n=1 Tax=Meganyctiphanes norvegica TaxID=48144 RepID=A0AAV2RM43_MEGNR